MSGLLQGQWFLDDPSNRFPPWRVTDAIGRTNVVTYATGRRQQTWTSKTNALFVIDDTRPEKIPSGAVMEISHSGAPAKLALSQRELSHATMTLTNGQTVVCRWEGGEWRMAGLKDQGTKGPRD